jgi:hypothetical protein
LETVAQHLERAGTGVREVLFVLFDQGFYDLHARVANHSLADRMKS